jgi:hypothetical protein
MIIWFSIESIVSSDYNTIPNIANEAFHIEYKAYFFLKF